MTDTGADTGADVMPPVDENAGVSSSRDLKPYIPLALAILAGLGWAGSRGYTYVSEQPWLYPTVVVCSERDNEGCTDFSLQFKNSGKTPAREVRYAKRLYVYGKGVPFVNEELAGMWADVESGPQLHADDVDSGKTLQLSADYLHGYDHHTKVITFGAVTWEDQWHRRHAVEFCARPNFSLNREERAESWDVLDPAACKKESD